ncbi:MAG: hypothetical protein ACHQJ6_01600 [Candidatus Berkiellales bacterium]
MKNENKENKVDIPKIFQNQDLVVQAIQKGIRTALLKHKQAGNPVCEWKDGKVVWVSPEKIPVDIKDDSASS